MTQDPRVAPAQGTPPELREQPEATDVTDGSEEFSAVPDGPDEPDETDAAGTGTPPAVTERERRRRLAAALDGALPEGTRDESGSAWGEREASGRDDEWFRSQVPPHHG